MRSQLVIDTEIKQLQSMKAALTMKVSTFGTDNEMLFDVQIGALQGAMHLAVLADENALRVAESAADWAAGFAVDAPSKEWLESPWLFA